MRSSVLRSDRAAVDIWIAVAIPLVLVLYNMIVHIAGHPYLLFDVVSDFPVAAFFNNVLYLWILGLLWFAHNQWQHAPTLQEYFASILKDAGPEPLLIIDEHERVIACNDAVTEKFGYDVTELVDHGPLFLGIRDPYAKRRTSQLNLDPTHFGVHAWETLAETKDGERIPLEIVASNLGDRPESVLMLRDISLRKIREEELDAVVSQKREAKKQLEELQLKYKLECERFKELEYKDKSLNNAIYEKVHASVSEIAREIATAEPRPVKFAADEVIEQRITQLDLFLRSVLDLHRIDSGEVKLTVKANDPSSCVRDAISELGILGQKHRFVIYRDKGVSDLHCDAPMLKQAIMHLMLLATEHTPASEEIPIRISGTDTWTRITVSDQGPAIPQKLQRVLFEKHWQMSLESNGLAKTTGLGLAYCKRVAQLQDGDVWMTQESKSTRTFCIALPVKS